MGIELIYDHQHQPHSLLLCYVAGLQESTGLIEKVLFIQCSGRNVLTKQHVLSITAFFIRLHRPGWRLSSFKV